MMIRITLIAFAILFVSSASATDNSIRGSSASASASASESRKLIALDEMTCEPTNDAQGSVQCTFRTVLPSNTVSVSRYNNCMTGESVGGEFCITTEVYRPEPTPPVDVFETVTSTAETVPSGTTIDVVPVTVPVAETESSEMRCPRYKPSSGSPCGGWLFQDSNFGSCMFGSKACECNNRANNVQARNIYWICDGDGYEIFEEAVIDITANVNQVAQESPQSQPQASGTINVPRPINDASCPNVQPNDGDTCVELKRCGYWDQPVQPTKLIDCRCDTYDQFRCRDADKSLYGYYYSSF